jgi:hypothetical protein
MVKDFNYVRKQLEEHLTAINENTSEIQAMLDFLQEVEFKIEKLSARIDSIQMVEDKKNEIPYVMPLNMIERKVFLVLYTEHSSLTYNEIAQKVQLPETLIPDYISSLVHKGIPLQRSHFNDRLFFKLDPEFKELQAKENIVNLSLQSFLD